MNRENNSAVHDMHSIDIIENDNDRRQGRHLRLGIPLISTLRDDHISLPKWPLTMAIGYISSLLCTSPKRSRGLLPADSVRAAQLSLLSQMLLEETLRPGVHQTSTQSLVDAKSSSLPIDLTTTSQRESIGTLL